MVARLLATQMKPSSGRRTSRSATLTLRALAVGCRTTEAICAGDTRTHRRAVTSAASALRDDFILTMCDHLYQPSVVSDLLAAGALNGGLTLAVDSGLDNPEIDLDDVTRVFQSDGRIVRIAKGLESYNCFDIGVFFCTPALFDAIERSVRQEGRGHIYYEDAYHTLLSRGWALGACSTAGAFWCEVDNARDLARAMGGDLDLGETGASGTRFVIVLPKGDQDA